MATTSKHFVESLSPNVKKALANKDNLKEYKSIIDKYIAANADKYMILGPGERPIFSAEVANKYINVIGLSPELIKNSLKSSKVVKSNWYIMNSPINVAIALATHHFENANNKDYITFTQFYLIVSMYPSIHFKYFKYGTNESCMAYTINNLSSKYKIKQLGSLWAALIDMVSTAYSLHKGKLKEGEDKAFVAYIQDVHTRINSFIKNIASEYYKNFEQNRYMQTEKDIYDEDKIYEADSNTYVVERLTGKIVTKLIVNGADMKLVQLAAKTNGVSVNELRTACIKLITEKHSQEISDMVESLLTLFLNANDEKHTTQDIKSNTFMIYCLQVYKKSNSLDKNILRIKAILDKWCDEVGIDKKFTRVASRLQYRRALYTFFVMSIQKMG